MVLTRRFQRLGDLAAGTMVVVEERRRRRAVDPGRRAGGRGAPALAAGAGGGRARTWRGPCRTTSSVAAGSAASRREEMAGHLARPLRDRYGLPADGLGRRRPLRRLSPRLPGGVTAMHAGRRSAGAARGDLARARRAARPARPTAGRRRASADRGAPARRALPRRLHRPDAGRGARPAPRDRGLPARPGRPGAQRRLPGAGVPVLRLGRGALRRRSPAGSGPTRRSGWRRLVFWGAFLLCGLLAAGRPEFAAEVVGEAFARADGRRCTPSRSAPSARTGCRATTR